MRRLQAGRRSGDKDLQERRVEERLRRGSFNKVENRKVRTLADAPGPGEFCRESMLGTRKADFIVGAAENDDGDHLNGPETFTSSITSKTLKLGGSPCSGLTIYRHLSTGCIA